MFILKKTLSFIITFKKIVYLEIIISISKKLIFSIFYFRRIAPIITFQILFLNQMCYAQEEAFNLYSIQSQPVSLSTELNRKPILVNSSKVSFSVEELKKLINISSKSVSYNTSALRGLIKITSKPVSLSISQANSAIKLSSKSVSLTTSKFLGELIKLSSLNVSFKTYNEIPILNEAIPNILPVTKIEKNINIKLIGDNFINGSVASIGTIKINTTYVSSNELIVSIPHSFIKSISSFEIFVINPPPNGSISNGVSIKVVNPTPIGKININPIIGVAPQIITVSASNSEDILQKYFDEKLSYTWNFGDEHSTNENLNVSKNETDTHEYKKPGKYKIDLEVKNSYGNSNIVSQEVEIRDKNEAPIVDAEYNIKEEKDFLEVIFSPKNTYDPEGDPISFNWNTGDTENVFSQQNLTYKYTKKGTYTPKLIVKDSLGAQTIKYLSPIEYLGPNQPPQALLNINPPKGILNDMSNFEVELLANNSFDSDGEIIKYEWEIKNLNDDLDKINHEGKEIKNIFSKAGEYLVKLKVTDNRNITSENTSQISITKPNPVANPFSNITSGQSPLKVEFNSNASDFDGSLVTSIWNFGDSSEPTTGNLATHIYELPGSYLPFVTVKANDGREKIFPLNNILVNESNGPHGVINIVEDIKYGVQNEAMIKLSASGSYDPELNQKLSYEWTWIAKQYDADRNLLDISAVINQQLTSSSENTKEDFSYTFTLPGVYTPILELTSEDGRKSKSIGKTISILPGQNPVAVAQITSDKVNGENTLEVKFNGSNSYDLKTDGGIVSYTWDFGDGEKSNLISPTHTYTMPGDFTPKLSVKDNRGLESIAFTNSIQITTSNNNPSLRKFINNEFKSNYKNLELISENIVSEISFSQENENPIDNLPPQITVLIENPTVKIGENITFNAHITDNVSVETVGYKIVDSTNKIILENTEPSPGNINIDSFMSNVDYVKSIKIPEHILPGKYKLLIFAKDKSDNWLGKFNSNEIISNDIEILDGNSSYNVNIIAEDSDEIINASIISEINESISNLSSEEISENIELIANIKNKNEINNNLSKKSRLKKNYLLQTSIPKSITVQNGLPSVFGAPNTNTYRTSIIPFINMISYSSSGPTLNLAIMTTIKSNDEKNFKGGLIEISDTGKIYTTICKVGQDCEIKTPSSDPIKPIIKITPINNNNEPLAVPKEIPIDKNDLFENENKTPEISSLSITQKPQHSGAFTFLVNGSMFGLDSKVLFNNSELYTEYLNPNTLSAFVPAWYIQSPKTINIQVRKELNNKTYFSNVKELTISEVKNKLFNLSKGSTLEILGSSETIIRSGGNVYIDESNTVFKEAGNVLIPFNLNENGNVTVEITGAVFSTEDVKIDFYHNSKLLVNLIRDFKFKTFNEIGKSKKWTFNLSDLNSGLHTFKISLPDLDGKTIFILNKVIITHKSNALPVISSINPSSVFADNLNDRNIEIIGSNFGNNPTVIYKDEKISTTSNGSYIKVSLPKDLMITDEDYVPLSVLNTESNITSLPVYLGIRTPILIQDQKADYKFNSLSLSASLNIEIKSYTKLGSANEAIVAVFNENGKIIINPASGKLKPTISDKNVFNGSFELPYDLNEGNYYIVSVLKRNIGSYEDYSSIEARDFLLKMQEANINNQKDFNLLLDKIPSSHKTKFTIGKNISPILNIFNVYKVNGVNFIQENQEFSVGIKLKGNSSKNLKVEVNFGDGNLETYNYLEEGLQINHKYKILGQEKFKEHKILVKVSSTDNLISESKEERIFTYRDFQPIGLCDIDRENYEVFGDLPFESGFLDKSFDPNQEL